MASGNTLHNGDLWTWARENPNSMSKERRTYAPVGSGGKRQLLRAPKGVDTDAIAEFFISQTYSATTGITINVCLTADSTNPTGNVNLGASVERLTASQAGSVISADSWGTEATATAAMGLPAGSYRYVTIAVPKASFGGATGASLAPHELARVRLRRVGSQPADTCPVDALIVGIEVQET